MRGRKQSEREARAADAEAAQKQAAAAEAEREALQRALDVRPTEAALEELRKHIRILQVCASQSPDPNSGATIPGAPATPASRPA